jgi:hypothetical protein
MTANQRRPGFRLPWSSEMEDQGGEAASGGEEQPMTPTPTGGEAATVDASSEGAAPEAPASPDPEPAAEMEAPAVAGAGDKGPAAEPSTAAADPNAAAASSAPPTDEFMRDLVAAMRGVADEARDTGVADARTRADERVSSLEADAETRRQEMRDKTEQDVAKIGEWEQSEHDRIKQEAEQRVVARRSQLDRQLEADTSRTDAESKAIRDRVAEYERELDAYHAQLIEINDPAAFAAAAKRMPKAPDLEAMTPAASTTESTAVESPAAPATPAPAAAVVDDQAPVEPVAQATNGVPEPEAEADPEPAEAQEEVLAARLAELDATLPSAEAASPAPAAPAAPAASGDPATTEVVVKGLGSFGAITGFRQALSGVEGIDAVALSLGQTGEFVFRASHAAGFDVRDAIAKLEGEGAKIEDRPEGGLRVTLDRAR